MRDLHKLFKIWCIITVSTHYNAVMSKWQPTDRGINRMIEK